MIASALLLHVESVSRQANSSFRKRLSNPPRPSQPPMDPVTAVSLVASIAQLIDATTKTIKYLNDVKEAPKDRATLAREATSLLGLLTDLRYRVEEANSTAATVATP